MTDTEQEEFAHCHPFALTAIGAEQVALRTFVADGPEASSPPQPAEAGHLLAQFADHRTVRRAASVLTSWHDQCEQRLAEDARRVRVRDVVTVEGLPGPAWWYRTKVKQRRSSPAVIELTGTVRVDTQLAVVVLRHRKGDYEPSLGREQIEAALRRAGNELL